MQIYILYFFYRNILDKIEINQYNSQFTIINGYDSSIIINTTNNILDFGYYNITNYRNGTYILVIKLNIIYVKYNILL